MNNDKIFIGSVKEGPFHKEGQVDLKIFVSGEDIKKITDHAKAGGPGTWKNDKQQTMINLRLKTSQGGKMYIEIDTWEPTAQTTSQKPEPVSAIAQEDDMPF